MTDTSLLRILVCEWTRQAQSFGNTDDERLVYSKCAEELHNAIQKIENK
jgi:hypothetical protein